LLGNVVRECIQKFTDWPPGARTANGIALCDYVQLYCHFVSQSSEFCRHNPLCCFSTSVYLCCLFRYDLVRKLLDTPSYLYFYDDNITTFLSSVVTGQNEMLFILSVHD